MFERYTEKARRVIFFARYEASEFGAPCIETEHILLGLLKEDEALAYRFLPSLKSTDSIRRQVRAVTPTRPKISTSVDLPLSHESKRVLAYAAEEADRLNCKHLGTEHLLLALLREEKGLAATLLRERGLEIEHLRQELLAHGTDSSVSLGELRRSQLLAYLESHTNGLSIFVGGSGIYVKPGSLLFDAAFLYIEILSATARLANCAAAPTIILATECLCGFLDPATRHVYIATPETGLQEFKGDVLRTESPLLELPLAKVFS